MQATSPLNQPLSSPPNPEDILGQFYFALGQGAGAMRIRQEAIAALRRRYYPAIKASAASWPDTAGHVLNLIAQVGRLSNLLATQAGRTAITAADFMQARRRVEASVHQIHERAGLMAGPFCPLVHDEVEAPTPSVEQTVPSGLGDDMPEELDRTVN